jgi:hypothetical protein
MNFHTTQLTGWIPAKATIPMPISHLGDAGPAALQNAKKPPASMQSARSLLMAIDCSFSQLPWFAVFRANQSLQQLWRGSRLKVLKPFNSKQQKGIIC